MKPIKTLDAARNYISELETDLSKAQAAAKSAVQPTTTPSDSGTAHTISAIDGKVRTNDSAAITPAKGLTLEPVTEDSLMEAIRGCKDWRQQWAMQRTLAAVQTARAVAEVKANKRNRR